MVRTKKNLLDLEGVEFKKIELETDTSKPN